MLAALAEMAATQLALMKLPLAAEAAETITLKLAWLAALAVVAWLALARRTQRVAQLLQGSSEQKRDLDTAIQLATPIIKTILPLAVVVLVKRAKRAMSAILVAMVEME